MLYIILIYAYNSIPFLKGFRPKRPSRKAQTKKYISQPLESRTGRVDALRFCKPRFTGERNAMIGHRGNWTHGLRDLT
jgi:hypothetical protein